MTAKIFARAFEGPFLRTLQNFAGPFATYSQYWASDSVMACHTPAYRTGVCQRVNIRQV